MRPEKHSPRVSTRSTADPNQAMQLSCVVKQLAGRVTPDELQHQIAWLSTLGIERMFREGAKYCEPLLPVFVEREPLSVFVPGKDMRGTDLRPKEGDFGHGIASGDARTRLPVGLHRHFVGHSQGCDLVKENTRRFC